MQYVSPYKEDMNTSEKIAFLRDCMNCVMNWIQLCIILLEYNFVASDSYFLLIIQL